MSAFATRCGFVGLGPPELREGDVVAILFGADVLFILRSSGRSYTIFEDCYVDEIMQGELIDLPRRNSWGSFKGVKPDSFKML